ncbi:MAG TPA: glycosyltransferase family 2 protein [Methylibium sp.]|uniref:glycosyltransferase family 2 protein n=1 Tax=Methylibium sp. TaxID=2067992 RepID=UPI002DB89639|nr:glycosyltransferase family 2 protein [Methylibium sp.]HEU4459115.1 glycosyltransferase family 2 protein [Methylibium sp.]
MNDTFDFESPTPLPLARPRISVVVPTCRRPAMLLRCLHALLSQDLSAHAYEVIVVDDGHDHATRALVEQLRRRVHARQRPALRYLRPLRGKGPAVARNAGWRAARGELIAFTDDDTVPERDWLAQGERSLAPWQAAVHGRVRVPVSSQPTDHERMTQGLERAEFVTANAFVRRAALEKVGGFDERFTRPWREDSDLQFRLETEVGPIGEAAEAVVVHPVRPEPWGVSLRQQRNVMFDALLYKKHRQRYRQRIRATPPWHYYAIVALALVALVAAFAGAGTLAAACAAMAGAQVLWIAGRRLARTSRDPRHVAEMLATSALIPFLSVYWRLRGALHWRVWFW